MDEGVDVCIPVQTSAACGEEVLPACPPHAPKTHTNHRNTPSIKEADPWVRSTVASVSDPQPDNFEQPLPGFGRRLNRAGHQAKENPRTRAHLPERDKFVSRLMSATGIPVPRVGLVPAWRLDWEEAGGQPAGTLPEMVYREISIHKVKVVIDLEQGNPGVGWSQSSAGKGGNLSSTNENEQVLTCCSNPARLVPARLGWAREPVTSNGQPVTTK
ncbi:hypothetical protein Bbelb_203820 [Branchiostoma belcheri]|nr:hypothetical protein Bbelb_203820 [Branchiostoma belcheri]